MHLHITINEQFCMLHYDITVALGRSAMHFLKLQLQCKYCTRFGMDICKYKKVKFNHEMLLTKKCIKSLIQGVIALICDIMASWLPPQPIQKLRMVLEQLCITDLTFNKRRLNEGIYKTLHKSGMCIP